jgi:hypothetical protein
MSEMSVGVSSSYLQQVLYIFCWAVIYLAKPQLILRAHNQLKFQQARMAISASSFSGMWLHFWYFLSVAQILSLPALLCS